MKFSLPFVLFFLLLSSHCAAKAESLLTIADRLEKVGCYRAEASFEVLLPNAEAPAAYKVDLESYPVADDSLSSVAYHICWHPDSVAKAGASGFSAYFNGNYYRYSAGKLQENHAAENALPFAPNGDLRRGVHNTDRHAALLPSALASLMREMVSDSTYESAVIVRGGKTVVKGSRSMRGYTISEFEYEFSPDGTPSMWEVTSNPGEMTEQVVTVRYTPSKADCDTVDEQFLISAHPEEFEKYRRDSFSLMNLKGEPLPSFNAATTDGRRYAHNRGDAVGAPMVVVVSDCGIDGNDEILQNVRRAVDSLPFSVETLMAFIGGDSDTVDEIAGKPRDGETILRNARTLVRNLGVVDFPSVVFVSPDGVVSDIHVGRNNRLRDIVIDKVMKSRRTN